jgi:hypothetical protein
LFGLVSLGLTLGGVPGTGMSFWFSPEPGGRLSLQFWRRCLVFAGTRSNHPAGQQLPSMTVL